jgi:hypothetical protein
MRETKYGQDLDTVDCIKLMKRLENGVFFEKSEQLHIMEQLLHKSIYLDNHISSKKALDKQNSGL